MRRRIDQLLVERGLFESRAKARAAIEAGGVRVAGVAITRPSELMDADAIIEAEPAHDYVGRGALKLEHALAIWPIDLDGKTALDVGASTGGFTEVLLRRGVRRVYAVDVGRGQLHARIAADPRVCNLEGVDARDLDRSIIDAAPDIVVCDASFIGLAKVLPRALDLAAPDAVLIALVKPQFEAGPADVGKGGHVKDAAVHARVLSEITEWLQSVGWRVDGLAESPIVGGSGAREHLIKASRAR
ncbi:MAG TPA: TlyA family RNA methyltransferase [Caulobacteraceae bacterium]|jgi:23S rRNA (cytidine1920-2'-O)/16S rRNA (cytidine1409-2'-O)-methyltransferase|nr:TlyA family RNA methyltransferase [Caulobacteraceae bacterium]